MNAYYNEIDGYAAQWLRNLIAADLIARGDVDERSIVDVCADDLRGYVQCHFFAGIGGWSVALRLADWGDDRPVWTGSCPCQPFSAAGAGKAADDERHLWPSWFPLIRELHPPVVFGEQVEAAIGWGWLDLVCHDLEAEGYAIGASVLPACSVGAPHIRQRTWFVADAGGGGGGRDGRAVSRAQAEGGSERCQPRNFAHQLVAQGANGVGQADADPSGRSELGRGGLLDRERSTLGHDADGCGDGDWMGDTALDRSRAYDRQSRPGREQQKSARGSSVPGGLGHTDDERRGGAESGRRQTGPWPEHASGMGEPAGIGRTWLGLEPTHPIVRQASPWTDLTWLPCTDGKSRPTKPGLFPLAHGVQRRPSKLRAFGNAIVPQVAAEFIRAFMDVRP